MRLGCGGGRFFRRNGMSVIMLQRELVDDVAKEKFAVKM
jgi:hypothetical protein